MLHLHFCVSLLWLMYPLENNSDYLFISKCQKYKVINEFLQIKVVSSFVTVLIASCNSETVTIFVKIDFNNLTNSVFWLFDLFKTITWVLIIWLIHDYHLCIYWGWNEYFPFFQIKKVWWKKLSFHSHMLLFYRDYHDMMQ